MNRFEAIPNVMKKHLDDFLLIISILNLFFFFLPYFDLLKIVGSSFIFLFLPGYFFLNYVEGTCPV